jgi:hypothetical protein
VKLNNLTKSSLAEGISVPVWVPEGLCRYLKKLAVNTPRL